MVIENIPSDDRPGEETTSWVVDVTNNETGETATHIIGPEAVDGASAIEQAITERREDEELNNVTPGAATDYDGKATPVK